MIKETKCNKTEKVEIRQLFRTAYVGVLFSVIDKDITRRMHGRERERERERGRERERERGRSLSGEFGE